MGMGLSYYERVGRRRFFGSAEPSDIGHGHGVVRSEIETYPTAFFYNNSKFYVHCTTSSTGVREFAFTFGNPKFYASCGTRDTGVRCGGYRCPVSGNLESVWCLLFLWAVLDVSLSLVPRYFWSAFSPFFTMELGLTTFP